MTQFEQNLISHFSLFPDLTTRLEITSNKATFFKFIQQIHEIGLDLWIPKSGQIHGGRTEHFQVWQSNMVLKIDLQPALIRVALNIEGNEPWQELTTELIEPLILHIKENATLQSLSGRKPYWPDDYAKMVDKLIIRMTDGAIRNGYLTIPKSQNIFPDECIEQENQEVQKLFTILLPNGDDIETKVLAKFNRIHARFSSLFAKIGLKEGDRIQLLQQGPYIYQMAFLQGESLVETKKNSNDINEEVKMIHSPLNQILFGPPGTGKTFNTINKALEILDPEYLASLQENSPESRKMLKLRFDQFVEEQRIRFTTFHQSFSYEDFVEGLKANNDEETGQLRYEVVDGIFKQVCNASEATITIKSDEPIDIKGRKIWKMSLGNTLGDDAFIYDECIQNSYALLGYGDQIDFSGCSNRKEIHERFSQEGYSLEPDSYAITAVATFLLKIKPGDLVVVTEGNYKFRAIGEFTSDYEPLIREDANEGYGQCRRVKWLRVYAPSLPYEQLMNKTFSQATIYQLHEGSIDPKKLTTLLNNTDSTTNNHPSNQITKGEFFGKYQVLSVNDELIELLKPNGSHLPVAVSIINELVTHVKNGMITLDDIKNAQVFEKIKDTTLERYLVNGYNNILPDLVTRFLSIPTNSSSSAQSINANNARVIIIDEINRGNISRIFGELITLIEPSKRQGAEESLEVVLPYSKERFSVPNNVYIIGTMNTADRSLAGLDIALRRRFTFIEMQPKPELLSNVYVEDINIGSLLQVINKRIEVLLDRDHCLGHAYFLPLKENSSIDSLATIFKNQIFPLLQEYFFEDWQRINWILNGHQADDLTPRFILPCESDNELAQLFGDEISGQLKDRRWQIDESAFHNIESYRQILKGIA